MAHADHRPPVLAENPTQSDLPYLSIVAASRNDDHGGDPLVRTQIFINNLARQCDRYKLAAELILIDWNPVQGRPGLAAVLNIPPETTCCRTRVITVPGALHRRLKYADQLPFFQMIAKNVGIRRAHGRFILATNIDILFSDELIQFVARQKLDPEKVYRVDRYDIRAGLSVDHTLDESMDYAWANPIRANRRYQPGDLIQDLYGAEAFKRSCVPSPEFRIPRDSVHVIEEDGVWEVRPDRGVAMTHLHTNACGDFTLLSREGWYAIRGYPEFEAFSWNIDSIGFLAAHYAGYQEVSLLPPCVCFHIEHGVGSGWTPEGEKTLFERLRQAQILNPEWPVLAPLVDEMRQQQRALEFNHSGWGMAEFDLHERPIGDAAEPPTERLNQLSVFAAQKRISAIQPEYDLDRLTLAHERRAGQAREITSAEGARAITEQAGALEAEPSGEPRRNGRAARINVTAGAAYLLMLLCVWGVFSTTSGMGWETYFTVYSESSPGWKGFLYTPDPLRIHNGTFFHLSYVIGELAGVRGSFVPYQIVYAALWFARSILLFLIVRRIFPGSTVLPFTVGALALVHSPDVLHAWLGQIHQIGQAMWLLLSFLMLITAMKQSAVSRTALYVLCALIFEYMCLWTYEGPFLIVLVAPILFSLLIRLELTKRTLVIIAAWYVLPATYIYATASKYLHSTGVTYQEGLLRKDLSVLPVMSDLVFNVHYSLNFISWLRLEPYMAEVQVWTLVSGATGVFVLGGLLMARWEDLAWTPDLASRRLWALLGVGLVFVVLSFSAYLLLEGARQPRRTLLLSAIGAAIVLGTTVSLVSGLVPRRWRPICALALALPIVWVGARRTIEREGAQREEWRTHLVAIQQILRAAPNLRDGTVIVMTNVPKKPTPFSHDYWFNNALRLAYPRTAVAGTFYYDDETAAPGGGRLRGGQWEFTAESGALPIGVASTASTLVLKYDETGTSRVLPRIPALICGDCVEEHYNPSSRILSGRPAPEAIRRYGPF